MGEPWRTGDDPRCEGIIVLVIEWQGWVIISYLAVFLVGLVLSFALRDDTSRSAIRVLTSVLSVPVLLLACAFLMLVSPLLRRTPTLAELQNQFVSKRTDLELILRMSNQDATFSRIAPTFVDRAPDTSKELARYFEGHPKALPEPRWDVYRRIYSRVGVDSGIQRNDWGDAFIMMDSYGMLDTGRISGYVFCSPDNSTETVNRFPPCVSQRYEGEKKMSVKNREGYSFRRITTNWYAYIAESG